MTSSAETEDTERSPQRYPALKTLSVLFRVLGWIVVVFGILVAAAYLVSGFAGDEPGFGIGLAIASLVGTALIAVLYFAISELVRVFMDTERNTRWAYEVLEELSDLLEERFARDSAADSPHPQSVRTIDESTPTTD